MEEFKNHEELAALNKKLCQKQNEIVKLKTDFEQMKQRNDVLEKEKRIRKQPEQKSTATTSEVNPVISQLYPSMFHLQKLINYES